MNESGAQVYIGVNRHPIPRLLPSIRSLPFGRALIPENLVEDFGAQNLYLLPLTVLGNLLCSDSKVRAVRVLTYFASLRGALGTALLDAIHIFPLSSS